MTITEKQQELLEELDLFQDWTERYEYVIGLGKKIGANERGATNRRSSH